MSDQKEVGKQDVKNGTDVGRRRETTVHLGWIG